MPKRDEFKTEAEWLEHLRLWFAGMALQGWIASFAGSEGIVVPEKSANLAYELADAMTDCVRVSASGL